MTIFIPVSLVIIFLGFSLVFVVRSKALKKKAKEKSFDTDCKLEADEWLQKIPFLFNQPSG